MVGKFFFILLSFFRCSSGKSRQTWARQEGNPDLISLDPTLSLIALFFVEKKNNPSKFGGNWSSECFLGGWKETNNMDVGLCPISTARSPFFIVDSNNEKFFFRPLLPPSLKSKTCWLASCLFPL